MKSLYLKSAIWDYLLVFAASIGMCYTLLNCFYVDPSLQYSPIPAVICAIVLLALFAVGANRKTLRIGIPLFAVVLVASWIVGAALTPDGAFLVDNESNMMIFVMCTTLTPTGVFLLSRRLTGAALLFIGGSFIIALVQFLYEFFDLAWALVFVAAALAGIVYRNYQMSLRSSSSVRKIAFAPGFAVAAGTCAVAVGLGCAVFFGIIAPLNPPAAEVKLLTEYRALETLRVKGIADVYQVPNLDMTSSETNEDERTTDDIKESPNGREYPASGKDEKEDESQDANTPPGASLMGVNLDIPDETFELIAYILRISLAVLALLLVVAAIAYFVGRRLYRKRRLEKLAGLPIAEQVEALYLFLVGRFEKLGIHVAPGQTLSDFAVANAATMEQFDSEAGVPFSALTSDYVAVAYGKQPLGEDAATRASKYYESFWKACRLKLGPVKYFFKSFRLG